MIGPPGAGKTLPARALLSIFAKMRIDEELDVTQIYSVADQLPEGVPIIRNRPLRSPHHTISQAGLVGGGNWPHPGEIPWHTEVSYSWMNSPSLDPAF
jgi:magnesium chelatase family protein